MKEPEIKLFGRNILLPETGRVSVGEVSSECSNGSMGLECDPSRGQVGEEVGEIGDDNEENQGQEAEDEDRASGEVCETKQEDIDQTPDDAVNKSENTDTLSELDNSPKTPSTEDDIMSEDNPKTENDQNEAANGQQKTLKKPDKILPCPRCNSMDTKFCYYNNYNINQPRHFCKSCQRYWTAGGTMRNVPVGAGRRKNKNPTSHCRHITISEALQAARIDAPNGLHHATFKPNGTVLSFGPDSPLCESMASSLNLADKIVPNGVRTGYYKIDQGVKNGEKKDAPPIGSSVTTSNPMADGSKNGVQRPVMQTINGFLSPVPCIPGVPWPFPWNSAVPLPTICPPGYPMPFYPTPYWNCGVPNAWNIPWLSVPPPPANQKGTGSSPSSPLGKHSRNGELIKPNSSESRKDSEQSSIVVPKTLRIDDPEEAAKSSIWSTLGIKYDSISREGLFKALQPKSDQKKASVTTSPVLQANPAALSRSLNFQERA